MARKGSVGYKLLKQRRKPRQPRGLTTSRLLASPPPVPSSSAKRCKEKRWPPVQHHDPLDGGNAVLCEPDEQRLSVDCAVLFVTATGFGFAPSPDTRACQICSFAIVQRRIERIAGCAGVVRGQFSQPERTLEAFLRLQSPQLHVEIVSLVALSLRIIMSLMEIEREIAPGANPEDPCRAKRHSRLRVFVHGIRNLTRKRIEIRKVYTGLWRRREFTNGPLRFVGHFPSVNRGMRTKFSEERNQYSLKQGFPPRGKFQDVLVRQRRRGGTAILHPQKIEQGKTQLQAEVLRQLERGGNIRNEKIIGSRWNSIIDGEAAAPVA